MKSDEKERKMSNLKINVLEVLKDKHISIKDFCKTVGLGKNMIYDLDVHLPTLQNAIKIANALNVSLDYLIGRSDSQEQYFININENNFIVNLDKILKSKHISKLKFSKELNLSTDCFTRWRAGAIPYLTTILRIADYLGCSIDELLGA